MALRRRHQTIRSAIGLALFALACLANAGQPCESADLGCAIFNGQHAIPAHLRDDDRALPDWTTRCINCHTGKQPVESFAPLLTPSYLLDAISRRGGPPSRYNPDTFCRVLKDGVDPASVMLRKSMPNYQISDTECAALWRYITSG
ncbi:hypothetical protein LMG24238_04567 [Paraburkholderia sediminicola]|uniref:Cytochrome c domain-containing protein n=1 Tax=Paraburkholderia sediminicola TaxID=458836 RepID=A0A6J5BS82_9BURK|nr:hypothetical protein [Paraburkholderia sediminicola]CAB3716621.1 hypothetical protein LMG24238_04567 [Paraburkholderia sediminicola]